MDLHLLFAHSCKFRLLAKIHIKKRDANRKYDLLLLGFKHNIVTINQTRTKIKYTYKKERFNKNKKTFFFAF